MTATPARLRVRFLGLAPCPGACAGHDPSDLVRLFHVRRDARARFAFPDGAFTARGELVALDVAAAERLAAAVAAEEPDAARRPTARALLAAVLLHEVQHALCDAWRARGGSFVAVVRRLEAELGAPVQALALRFLEVFPTPAIYAGEDTPERFLARGGDEALAWIVEELVLLHVAARNQALEPFRALVSDHDLGPLYARAVDVAAKHFAEDRPLGPRGETLLDLLLGPARAGASLEAQIGAMQTEWGLTLDLSRLDAWVPLLRASDLLREEARAFERAPDASPAAAPPGPPRPALASLRFVRPPAEEPEAYTEDEDWMPRVVLLAKSTFVWLDQLSKAHGRPLRTLADVPDEELARIASRGFNALWLIGLFRRSEASRRIKRMRGDHEALASAYALHDYSIAPELGGEPALDVLRARAARHGLRLAADMVPNHVGLDGDWVVRHPERFLQTAEPPFPVYRFTGENLGSDPHVEVRIEDGYWTNRDAAVVFERRDRRTGDVRYLYHGNDGTSTPWNDTAQLDFTRADVREAIGACIVDVARRFPILRMDAAMVLATRHIQRLWFPPPGQGGAIPSRAERGLDDDELHRRIPVELWREVVDRVAREAPDTLLLAEAFWMMEGYFVRSLGMHRVYNSAFMHMLEREENAAYKETIANVLVFDRKILERYVNFMSNPDEATAVEQFGDGDKYFAVATLMATMPGLPMVAHGQVEGLAEKYGMEFAKARRDERPRAHLVARHEREIFPLFRARSVFAGVARFALFEARGSHGEPLEHVFAYANREGGRAALVLVHNRQAHARGVVHGSVPSRTGQGALETTTLLEALGLGEAEDDAVVVLPDVVSGAELAIFAGTLRRQGLVVALGPYARRVYLDVRLVRDADGYAAREACAELDGRPVPSFDREARRLATAPGRAALARAATPLRPLLPEGPEGDVAFAWLVAATLLDVAGAPRSVRGAAGFGLPAAGRARRAALADLLDVDAVVREALVRVGAEDAAHGSAPFLARVLDAAPRGTLVEALAHALDDPWGRAVLGVHDAGGATWLRREGLEALVAWLWVREDLDDRRPLGPRPHDLTRLAAAHGYDADAFRAALDEILHGPAPLAEPPLEPEPAAP